MDDCQRRDELQPLSPPHQYDKNFQLIYSGSALSYKDMSANANYNYTYYVAATTKEGRQLSSNEKTALISSNSASNNTSTTTTKPPVTKRPVTNPPVTTPPITKGPTPTITTTPTPPPQWSAWTQWSTTPVSSSSTRQVETKVETETYSIPVYHYSRWHYYNTGYNNGTIPMLSIRVPTISRVLEIGNT